jgi:hypothetical protein
MNIDGRLATAIHQRAEQSQLADIESMAVKNEDTVIAIENSASTASALAGSALQLSGLIDKTERLQFPYYERILSRLNITKTARVYRAQRNELLEAEPIEWDLFFGDKIIEPHPDFVLDDKGRISLEQTTRLNPRGFFVEDTKTYVSGVENRHGFFFQNVELRLQDIVDPWKVNETGLVDVDIYREVRVAEFDDCEREPIFHTRSDKNTKELKTFWTYREGKPLDDILGNTEENMLHMMGLLAIGRRYLEDLLPDREI